MTQKVPVHNNTAMPIYVGATMIPAGETRHFDLQDVPHHLRPAPVAPAAPVAPSDPVDELSAKSVKDIVAALPGLSVEDLERLGEIEQKKTKPRNSLLTEISEALLARAGTGGE